jgi:hypothetical protein
MGCTVSGVPGILLTPPNQQVVKSPGVREVAVGSGDIETPNSFRFQHQHDVQHGIPAGDRFGSHGGLPSSPPSELI